MQRSIFTRYFSTCAALVIASITVLGALFLVFASQYFKNDKYRLLESNAVKVSQELQERFEQHQVQAIRDEFVTQYLQAVSETIDATFFITDRFGDTLYCTELSPCIHTEHDVPVEVMDRLHETGRYVEMGTLSEYYSTRCYTVAVPIHNRDAIMGYIFASTDSLQQQQSFLIEIFKMFLLSAVFVLVITFVAVYFISLQMVRPVRQMVTAAQKFGRGEFDTRLEIAGNDEIAQLAAALNNMAQSLSTMETAQRSFTANISHELKTPMTSISGFVDGILDGTIPPEKQHKYLQIVSDEIKRLSRLVKTILNLSRIEAGEMQLHKTGINIVDTVCRTVFSFEQDIEKKGITIEGLDHDRVMVEADPDLIHQAIYNLTENAVKFVNEGGCITFDYAVDAENTYISVKNSGAGLAKEELPKIFERFYKSDRSRGLDQNGVGLGLYIVRSIIALHGGEILVKSSEGDYVEFVFSIPHPAKTGIFKKI